MSESIKASPLSWPAGWPRTSADARRHANFSRREQQVTRYGDGSSHTWDRKRDLTIADSTRRVQDQLDKMGVKDDDVVISTNLDLRLDGLPRSGQRAPHDPGAAVYWIDQTRRRKVMAIDVYDTVQGNLAAIAATLDAMRAIERHGGAVVLERAFTGFTALPAPIVAGMARPWHEVFGIPAHTPTADVEVVYRRLRSEAHPDRKGGSHERMAAVNVAWDQFKTERGLA